MADTPLPPATPPKDTGEDLSNLSPFKVLQKRGSTDLPVPGAPAPTPPPAPVAPRPIPLAPVPPVAEPTGGAFILPTDVPVAPTPPPPPPVAPVAPAPIPPKPAPAMAPPPPPPAKPTLPPPAPTPPPASKPGTPIPPPLSPVPQRPPQLPPPPLSSEEVAARQALVQSVPKRRNVGLISFLGLIIALGILAGTGYILASNGSGVPVFYKMVSGLEPNAKNAAVNALVYMKEQQSHLFSTQVTINPKGVSETATLPDGADDVDSPVYSLKSAAEGVYVAKAGAEMLGKMQVSINSGTPIIVALHSRTDSTSPWPIYFADNAEPEVVTTDPAELKKTLLYPVLRPTTGEQFMTAITGSHSLQKRNSAGKTVSAYSVQLDPTKLAGAFPEGAKLTNVTGVLELTWKGKGQLVNQPVAALLNATLSYEGKDYEFKQIWNFTEWKATIPANEAFAELTNEENVEVATQLSIQEIVGQLAIASLSQLPNSIEESNGGVEQSSQAAVPTGEAITTPGITITTSPPVPVQPASEAAKKRDTQRKADAALLKTALEKYKKDTGSYPIASAIEQTVSSNGLFTALVPDYLTKMPVDPLANTYWYEYQSDGKTFVLRTVLEDASDTAGKKGAIYSYFEVTNN